MKIVDLFIRSYFISCKFCKLWRFTIEFVTNYFKFLFHKLITFFQIDFACLTFQWYLHDKKKNYQKYQGYFGCLNSFDIDNQIADIWILTIKSKLDAKTTSQ